MLAAATADPMGPDGVANLIAFVAVVLSLLSFIYSAHLDRETRKREKQRDRLIDERELRIEKSTAYLQLELASTDVFKYRAAHWEALHWAETGERVSDRHEGQLEEEADQYFYQCLNLFEICSRFRHEEIIDKEIYGSWVAWFFEELESSYFRRKWPLEYCDNYTEEVRAIFDFGCQEIDWDEPDQQISRGRFYRGVGEIVDCDVIRNWRVEAGGSKLARLRAAQTASEDDA